MKIGGGLNSVDQVKRDRWVDAKSHMRMRLGVGFVIAVTPIVDDIRASLTALLLSLCCGKTCREIKLSIDRLLACQATFLPETPRAC